MLRMRHLLTAAALAAAAVMLAACTSANNPFNSNPFSSSAPEASFHAAAAAEPAGGRYRRSLGGSPRITGEAGPRPYRKWRQKGACSQAYLINRSPSGGVVMLGPRPIRRCKTWRYQGQATRTRRISARGPTPASGDDREGGCRSTAAC